MRNILLLLFVPLLFWSGANAQVPLHISRTEISSPATVRDSAQRSITLLPGFNWTATSGRYYEAKITGILPVSPGTVTIDWPKSGQIVQRNNSNNGWVYVSGSVSDAGLTSVRVEASPVQGGASNQKVLTVNSAGNFEGAIQLSGGDYNLVVREYMYGTEPKEPAGSSTINRVGVGEVFMLMGFSYMEGGHPNPYSQAANDERVRTIPGAPFNPNTDNVPDWINGMPFSYHKIVNNVGPGPNQSWAYGLLGDNLANRYGVPVLIYSGAFGGTSIYNHERNIAGDTGFITDPNNWYQRWAQKGFPHASIRAITDKYVPKSGVRAILIHHGGNDRAQINDFTSNFNTVMNDITSRISHNNFAAFIAIDGPFADYPANDGTIGFVNQINNIIGSNSNYYAGAQINSYTGPARWDENSGCGECGHFKDTFEGMSKYEELWRNALPSSSGISNLTFKEADIPAHLKF